MRLEEAIGRNSEIMSGELCFRGTRVPVKNLFDHLEVDGFPRVSRAQFEAVLEGSYARLAGDFGDQKVAV